MSKLEYWCGWGKHWVDEMRANLTDGTVAICKSCTSGKWETYQPAVRQVKEPRYIVQCIGAFQEWCVFDTKASMSVDVDLSEKQAYEMAATRNKWEA